MQLDDDSQLGRFLTMNGVFDEPRLAELRANAEATARPLYVALIEDEVVDERKLVEMLSRVLGVRSVVLEHWQGEADVLRLLPNDFIRGRGVLPLGIDLTEDPGTLYVAMANPGDKDTVAEVRAAAGMPVLPVLAGPSDLLAAIHRHVGTEGAMPPPPLVRPGGSTADANRSAGSSNLFASVDDIVDFYDDPANIGSALSILDDIPDDRHDRDTSPSGIEIPAIAFDDENNNEAASNDPHGRMNRGTADDALDQHLFATDDKPRFEQGGGHAQPPMPGKASESALPLDPGSHRKAGLVPEPISDQTGMGLPSRDSAGASRSARRSAPHLPVPESANAAATIDYRKASAALLSRAAVKLLLDKGVIDEDELNAALAAIKW